MPARLGYALATLAICAFAAMVGVWLAARGDEHDERAEQAQQDRGRQPPPAGHGRPVAGRSVAAAATARRTAAALFSHSACSATGSL